ncbi:MAG: arginase family protein, partial [Firmicutes bacterium]|nr:arginase family protein [Bacillota bacterium]
MNRFIFVNPQWQGGNDMDTYHGAREIEDFYLYDVEYTELEVSQDSISLKDGEKIIGQDIILKQTENALEMLRFAKRGKSLTVGGGCDADVASIYYLNQHFTGDLAVLWFDAHGDLNTPSESGSKLFYGMPVRTLLGESDGVFDHIITEPLQTDQIINVGGRVLDDTETAHFEKSGIPVIPVHNNERLFEDICQAVRATGKRRLYIHLDLDVLDPCDEVSTPVPEADGLSADKLMPLLERL